ncbi:MAG: DUF1232 domain-containing protein [Betaproteobacteria bacterium]|jgi:uncharacterized membrane protein YkvA (DUF1232 family)|nr:MAG: DUF1232 domain-containing protein [Betaproteobacteria bacterium]
MLLALVHKVSDIVSAIDPIDDAPAFVDNWLEHRPEQRDLAFTDVVDGSSRETVFRMFAAGALTIVKRIPRMVDVMIERLHSDKVDPAVQCAVATVLAYLVQPRDLIPDNAPGGYGFIDDTILLHAGFLDILAMEPPHAEQFKTQQEYLSYISSFAPPSVMSALQQTVQSMESTLSVFRMLPREALEVTTRIIIDEPLRVSTIPVSRREEFHSAEFLEHAGEEVVQQITSDGDTIVLQFPGGGIASDGERIYSV